MVKRHPRPPKAASGRAASVLAGTILIALSGTIVQAQSGPARLDVAITSMQADSYYCRFDFAITNSGQSTVDRLGFRVVPYSDDREVGDTWGDSVSNLSTGQTAAVSLAVANIPDECDRVDAYDIIVTACRIDGANQAWRVCREAMTLATDLLPIQE